MIRLTKTKLGPELQAAIAERTNRLMLHHQNGEPIPNRLAAQYKEPAVKNLIKLETHEKCAYCESKITHIDFGDVEHIIPKALRPDLTFNYDNLTLACGICNGRKGDYFDEDNAILNPYMDEPRDHLRAFGPVVLRTPASDRGLITEKKLDLNRGALVEKRQERLEAIASLLDQIYRAANPAVKKVLIEQVAEECQPSKEYAFVVQEYVKTMLAATI